MLGLCSSCHILQGKTRSEDGSAPRAGDTSKKERFVFLVLSNLYMYCETPGGCCAMVCLILLHVFVYIAVIRAGDAVQRHGITR